MSISKEKVHIFKLALLIIPFVEPTYVQNQLSGLHSVYTVLKVVAFGYVILQYMLHRRRISKACLLVMSFFGFLLLLTIINGFPFFNAVRTIIPSISICLIIEIYIIDQKKELMSALTLVLGILTVINFVSILMFPNGMYSVYNEALGNVEENWFLGYKNPQIRVILPAVACYTIDSYIRKGKITLFCYAFFVISALSAYLVDSSTALVAMLLFTLLIFVVDHFKIGRFFNVRNFFMASVIVYIICLGMSTNHVLSSFLEVTLGRDATFTGRNVVWLRYIAYFLKGNIFGTGIASSTFMFNTFACSHPHNFYLYVFLQGGIVGALIIVGLICSVSNKLVRYSGSNQKAFVLTITLGIFLIMGIMESLTEAVMLYPMFVLAGNIDYLSDEGNEERSKKHSNRRKIRLTFGGK